MRSREYDGEAFRCDKVSIEIIERKVRTRQYPLLEFLQIARRKKLGLLLIKVELDSFNLLNNSLDSTVSGCPDLIRLSLSIQPSPHLVAQAKVPPLA